MTDAETIHALQTSLLMEIAKHSSSPSERFVALVAFSAEHPVKALQQMQEGKHDSLPAPGNCWLFQSAIKVSEAIYA
ncbi:MAG: hypothetical protein KUG74_10820 [Rhodobacteraceae bacterium]|nr:hypothetical protein [Paracoccaceae bacterium]